MKKIALILSASIFFFVSVYGLEISINWVDKDESSPGNYEDNYSFKTNMG